MGDRAYCIGKLPGIDRSQPPVRFWNDDRSGEHDDSAYPGYPTYPAYPGYDYGSVVPNAYQQPEQ